MDTTLTLDWSVSCCGDCTTIQHTYTVTRCSVGVIGVSRRGGSFHACSQGYYADERYHLFSGYAVHKEGLTLSFIDGKESPQRAPVLDLVTGDSLMTIQKQDIKKVNPKGAVCTGQVDDQAKPPVDDDEVDADAMTGYAFDEDVVDSEKTGRAFDEELGSDVIASRDCATIKLATTTPASSASARGSGVNLSLLDHVASDIKEQNGAKESAIALTEAELEEEALLTVIRMRMQGALSSGSMPSCSEADEPMLAAVQRAAKDARSTKSGGYKCFESDNRFLEELLQDEDSDQQSESESGSEVGGKSR